MSVPDVAVKPEVSVGAKDFAHEELATEVKELVSVMLLVTVELIVTLEVVLLSVSVAVVVV